jgi:anti-sigma regulatory factor (Ser/Thr protein kinase)
MPDDVIRLVLPAAAEFAPVASVAVRAVARQVALPETEIDRLRAAVVEAFTAHVGTSDQPIELTFDTDRLPMRIAVGATVIE